MKIEELPVSTLLRMLETTAYVEMRDILIAELRRRGVQVVETKGEGS